MKSKQRPSGGWLLVTSKGRPSRPRSVKCVNQKSWPFLLTGCRKWECPAPVVTSAMVLKRSVSRRKCRNQRRLHSSSLLGHRQTPPQFQSHNPSFKVWTKPASDQTGLSPEDKVPVSQAKVWEQLKTKYRSPRLLMKVRTISSNSNLFKIYCIEYLPT